MKRLDVTAILKAESPKSSEQIYLVGKGARKVALIHVDVSGYMTKRALGSYKVGRLLLEVNDGIPTILIWAEGASDKEANLLKDAWYRGSHGDIGIALGYAPELVDEFMVRLKVIKDKTIEEIRKMYESYETERTKSLE